MLIEHIHSLNPSLPEKAVSDAMYKLQNYEAGDIVQKNEVFMDYLQHGIPVRYTAGGEQCSSLAYIVDYKNIDNSILELNKNVDYLFIYGTSRLATICYKQLENEGIEFAGYVVSDGQMKMDEIDHKKVFYLSEAVKNYENAGFILAVQPVNINDIEQQLQKYHVKNFCIPYNI